MKEEIKKLIYIVRGKKVMFDSDLAILYGYKTGTKSINKIVSRNRTVFNDSDYFRLTHNDLLNMDSIIETTNLISGTANLISGTAKNYSKVRTMPYVFTLSGVIKLSHLVKIKGSLIVSKNIILSFEDENNLMPVNPLIIENLIYEVRGQKVMLDSDLAYLYQVETKRINEAVKNNPVKFPDRYTFILRDEEETILRSKFSTANISKKTRSKPRVFTEQGVYMLATILKSKIASLVTLNIMDAFVLMRKYLSDYLMNQKYINNMVLKHESNIIEINKILNSFDKDVNKTEIYYKGQIFDAYSKIYEILSSAKSNIVIIDNYADNVVLDIIKKLDVKVTIITKKNNLLSEQDILKYNRQYHNLNVIFNSSFHDRYFILDDSILYHCGTSINRIGYKTFSINLLSDKDVTIPLINNINSIK